MLKTSAENVERRVSTKRNSASHPVTRTQSLGQTANGLDRIRTAAKKDTRLRFTNLFHHLTVRRLTDAYYQLNKKAAKGVDDISWQDYGEALMEHLHDLHKRLHTGRYHPQASKRCWIPKPNGQRRPIGMAAVEDKIVQHALVKIMQSIYEEDFLGFSYGYRPGRHQHKALDALYVAITQKKVSWILDADLKGFFDSINHEWMMKFLEHRIADRRILRLLNDMLKAGVIEEGKWSKTVAGTPQGATISSLLSNIYLHYALDLWVQEWRKQKARGEVYIVRYADDFVLGYQYQTDGRQLYEHLHQRLSRFHLTLHENKTRLIEFGRFAASNRQTRGESKPETFSFLGLVHICSQQRKTGAFKLLRITNSKQLRAKAKDIKEKLMRHRAKNAHVMGKWLRSVVHGYYNYHGVPGNYKALDTFRCLICRAWFRSLRRRSHKAQGLNWNKMQRLIKQYIPSVKTTHPYPNQRLFV